MTSRVPNEYIQTANDDDEDIHDTHNDDYENNHDADNSDEYL